MHGSSKQMCLCFKVFFRVLVNLVARYKTELADAIYKMCLFCCCSKQKQTAQHTDYNIIGDATETFYQNVNRHDVELLLKHRQNGTFIIRPSKKSDLGTLSLVQDEKIFHLNIRRRENDNLIALGMEKMNEKCFDSLNSLINYYISNYLVLYSSGTRTLTLLLPYRDKNENYNGNAIS
ncbi:uncharacterized protein LOC143194022 [Rhynchophorus ferrugineus]|uniref:uncharacterized protein LOC143194022 n=1 Tax=Rhynchophorus ferrugineus TaxID=354439 RepID=UPI003FCD0475